MFSPRHRFPIKAFSLIIIGTMSSVVMFAGCSSGKKAEDDNFELAEWYDSEKVKLVDMSNVNGFGYSSGCPAGFLYTDGEVILIEEMFHYGADPEETHKIEEYSIDGELLISIDVNTIPEPDGSIDPYGSAKRFVVDDGQLVVFSNFQGGLYISRFDEESGSFGDWEDIDISNADLDPYPTILSVGSDDDGIKLYYISYGMENMSGIKAVTVADDLSVSSVDYTDALSSSGLSDVEGFFRISDHEYLVKGWSSESGAETIILDTDTMQTRPFEGLDGDRLIQCGDNLCTSDGYTISKFDPSTETLNEVFNLDRCNINRYEAAEMFPVIIDDEKIVLYGMVSYARGDMSINIIKLTPSDTNPNAGKTRLTMVDMEDYLNYPTAEAIRIFNDTNPNAYIVMEDKYNLDRSSIEDNESWEYTLSSEYASALAGAEADLGNQLMVDLMSGEGPDIILNGYFYSILNNDNCLVDLTSYIDGENGVDRSRVFDNVFDGNEYQIPLMAQPYGVVYSSDETGFDSVAPTFEEYSEFVHGPCNGADPIGTEFSRLEYFLTLLENIYPEISDDKGRPQLDNDEFRALAEYCIDLPETAGAIDDIWCDVAFFNPYSIYWGDLAHGYDTLMGLPSLNGIGHRFRIVSSVGISATCPDVADAWQFVSLLLSEDIQSEGYNPEASVLRDVARDSIESQIARNNEEADNYEPVDDRDEGPGRIDEGVADIYIGIMDSALPCSYLNPDIKVVFYEEMQAYFAGAKTLDEIIPIIEDRCSTIINEQG